MWKNAAFSIFCEGIRGRLARGGPSDNLLRPYLDFRSGDDPIAEFAAVIAFLYAAPLPQDRRTLTLHRMEQFAATLCEARCRVQAVQRLQLQIVEAVEAEDRRAEAVETEEAAPQTAAARGGGRQHRSEGTAPARLSEFALALDERRQWYVFRRVAGQWRSTETIALPNRRNSWSATLLAAFLDGKGVLTRDRGSRNSSW